LIATIETSGKWISDVAPMNQSRKNFAALAINSQKKILVIGDGISNLKNASLAANKSMEVYDVATNKWEPTLSNLYCTSNTIYEYFTAIKMPASQSANEG